MAVNAAFHERADMYQTLAINAFDTPNVQQRRFVFSLSGMLMQAL